MATNDNITAYMGQSLRTAHKKFKSNVNFHANFCTQDEAKNLEIYQFASAALNGIPRLVNGKINPSWAILSNLCHILKKEGLGF